MNKDRFKRALPGAIIFGILCVISYIIRFGYRDNFNYLLALFYNRLLIGIVLSFLVTKKGIIVLIRGTILGLLIGLGLYIATEFQDLMAVIGGGVTGIIVDAVASKYTNIFIRFFQNIITKINNKLRNNNIE